MTKTTMLAVVMLYVRAGALLAVQPPVITTATINATANQITITGLNLAPASGAPAVGLGYAELTVLRDGE